MDPVDTHIFGRRTETETETRGLWARGLPGGVLLIVALLAPLLGELRAASEDGAKLLWQTGVAAPYDVITPVALIVPDPDRTEQLRQQEASRQPVFFRFLATAGEEVEASLRSAWAETRDHFWDAVEAKFGRRILDAKTVAEPRFRELWETARYQVRSLPLTPHLAEVWALGESDVGLQSQFALRLREVMGRFIRRDVLNLPAAHSGIRILAVRSLTDPLDLTTADRQARSLTSTNLTSLTQARADLQRRMAGEDPATVTFLASLIRENCVYDETLTQQRRAKAMEIAPIADTYPPGQWIVKKGEVIDARAARALVELRRRAPDAMGESGNWLPWVVGQSAAPGLLAAQGGTLLAFGFWWWTDRRRRARIAALDWNQTSSAVLRSGSAVVASAAPGAAGLTMSYDAGDGAGWRERALVAEERAEKATAMLKEGLLPHLARWMSVELVQKLMSQRRQLVDSQEMAIREMAKFEERLEQIRAPLVDRLQAYEARIQDLEHALVEKDHENRALLEAQINIARMRLESERQQGRAASG